MPPQQHIVAALIFALASFWPLFAQDVTVNRSNKTVEVTVTSSVDVNPEVAVITIGYQNYGSTQDSTFADNTKAGSRITRTLVEGGIPKGDIQTESVKLESIEPDPKWSPQLRAERKFGASESWSVRVPPSQAEGVLALAVKASANEVEDVDWEVKDPDALEAKASAAALAKARGLADQMVRGLGAKLGDLLYTSNLARRPKGWPFSLATASASVSPRRVSPEKPVIHLFPKKVHQEATVHAIFAIE